jgi:hypothetical protein
MNPQYEREANALVYKDIRVLLTPTWFLSFVLDSLTQRVGPTKSNAMSTMLSRAIRSNLPLNPALLPSTPITHPFTDFTPKDITINVLPLLDSHFGNNASKLLFLLFLPVSYTP